MFRMLQALQARVIVRTIRYHASYKLCRIIVVAYVDGKLMVIVTLDVIGNAILVVIDGIGVGIVIIDACDR